jgi:hypothetical protein
MVLNTSLSPEYLWRSRRRKGHSWAYQWEDVTACNFSISIDST